MAYLDENRFDEESLNPLAQGGDVGAGAVGGANVGSSNAASSAGVGPGGTGGWTNIQSYLGANAGNNSTGDAVSRDFGSQISKEREGLSSAASSVKSLADKQNEHPSLESALGDEQQGEQLKSYLSKDYAGPNDFSYGLSNDTQNYGSGLSSRDGWQGILNNVYGKASPGGLTTGQKSLQEQLDVNNPYLADTQKKLKGDYDAFNTDYGNTLQGTQSYLNNAKSNFNTTKEGVKGEINQAAGVHTQKIADLEAKRDTWNPLKQGDWQSLYDNENNARNRLYGFLGMNPVNPNPGVPKGTLPEDEQEQFGGKQPLL